MPKPASSPWILRYPQPRFSRASRRTSAWMFLRVVGRPVLPRMDLAAQRRRTMSRCQRTIVSGITSSLSPCWLAFGIRPSGVAIRARSAQFSFGRHGCRRCRTTTWWRRIRISAVFHASSRRDSRSHAAILVIRRKTNRRHMVGDHHGRTAGRQPCWSGPWTTFFGTHRVTPAGGQASDQTNMVGQAGPATRGQVRRKARHSGQIRSESPGPPGPILAAVHCQASFRVSV
jgi:hypothetical protein